MKKKLSLLNSLFLLFSFCFVEAASMVDHEYVKNFLTKEAPWADSHAAKDGDLGAGMLYYSLVYAHKARLCVCLGSGGGFVPRVMRQAQRDLGLRRSRVVLVDGNMGEWGRPAWLQEGSFFLTHFPEIEVIVDTTHKAALSGRFKEIHYLHIDADHSLEGVLADFYDYLPLMKKNGIITIHDTGNGLPCSKIVPILKQQGYEMINFKSLGAGVAIVYLDQKE